MKKNTNFFIENEYKNILNKLINIKNILLNINILNKKSNN